MNHIDTHVALWLRAGDRARLKPIRRTLDVEDLAISPFAILELQALFEIGRIRETGRWVSQHLFEDYGVTVADSFLAEACDRAVDLSFTRDPFDRLIGAHALASGVPLLTVDEVLLEHLPCARWGSS
ncbi:MAG: PIN domain-containing protein [Myxococcaceae bacterium]|nr:PIN domain-containing protein [Myxococcaceae bacterium]